MNINRELDEFKYGLNRVKRILKLEIPLDIAITIEKNQLTIIKSLLPVARDFVKRGSTLEDLISQTSEKVIKEYYYKFAEDLDVRNNVEEPKEALNNLIAGRTDTNGTKIVVLITQAIARSYATAYEEIYGIKEVRDHRCPLCGSESDIIVKWSDGSYRMICPFCGYMWIISRNKLVCPKCGSTSPVSLGVFTNKEMKVGLFVCQDCGFKAKIILDPDLASRIPRILLPLLASAGDRFRGLIRE